MNNPTDRLQDRSLIPVVADSDEPSSPPGDFVFCEYYTTPGPIPTPTPRRSASTTKKIIVYHGGDQRELYVLKKEPDESDNLWSDPSQTDR